MTGFVNDLPEQEYHAHKGSLSVSGAKVLLKAPALFKWQQDNPVYKDVFDFGTAAHKMILGVGADLVIHEYDPAKVKSPKSTNAWKAQQAEVREAGAVLLLPEEHASVQAMADKLSEHTLAMTLLSNGEPEVSAFCLDEPTGVMRRGRFDYLGKSVVTDYKSAASSEPTTFATAAARYGYHMQAAWYLDLARDLGHPAQAFAFIVQEKEPPYLVTVVELDDAAIQRGRDLNREALERFRDCTDAGKWPGYVRDDDIARVSLPRWAFYDNETSIA